MVTFWISGAMFGSATVLLVVAVLAIGLAPHVRTRLGLTAGVMIVIAAISAELGRQEFEAAVRQERVEEIQLAMAGLKQEARLTGDVRRMSEISGEIDAMRRELAKLQKS